MHRRKDAKSETVLRTQIFSPLPLGEGAQMAGEGNNDTKNKIAKGAKKYETVI